MIDHVNSKTDGAPKGARPAPPRNTGVQGPKPPTYSQILNQVLFNCPTCRQENKVDKTLLVFSCERCGNQVDRRVTLPTIQNGLKIDWITCTFQTSKILEKLADLKPLESSDLKWIQREEDTREAVKKDLSMTWEEKAEIQRTLCPFFKSGLKSTKSKTPFWDKDFDWFRGARVAQGSQGKTGDKEGDKSQNCMLKIPGKALEHLRKISGKDDLEIVEFLLSFGAKFSRLDLALDHLPGDKGEGIINPCAQALRNGFFTSTWDRERTPPKFIEALDFRGTKGKEGQRPAESIIETITLGSRKSETFGRIYDKRRELIATGHQDPEQRWERYEIEIKKKRAEALGKEIGSWGKQWKKEAKGLFLRFLNIRDENHDRARMKERKTSPWYDDILEQASETTLQTPRQVKKDREEHRATTVEQSGKRLFKVFLADLKEGGLSKLGDTLEALIQQAIKGMMPEDWEQLFDHLKIPNKKGILGKIERNAREQVFDQSNLLTNLLDFTQQLKAQKVA